MNTPVKIISFAAGLVALFGVAVAAGNAVGPLDEPAAAAHGDDAHSETTADVPGSPTADDAVLPGGLMVTQNGYTLSLTETIAAAGRDVPVSFVVNGPDGDAVSDYETSHDKLLHLIAVRRDLSGFQHVHPELSSEDAVWSTSLDLTPGEWRLYADFKAEGADPLTLGADLSVAGRYQPISIPEPFRTAQVDDYTVTLRGELRPGTDSKLTLSVSQHGKPVTDLQPYLGAYGHLVALRDGDLAYLHVHPDGASGDDVTDPGPDVVFYAAVPSVGSYRLFLDFRQEGVVRTAAFTVTTGGHAQSPASAEEPGETGETDDHGDH